MCSDPTFKMLGGYQRLWKEATAEKTVANLAPGYYEFSFVFYAIDYFGNYTGTLEINGNTLWSKKFKTQGTSAPNKCGNSYQREGDNFQLEPYVVTFYHDGGP